MSTLSFGAVAVVSFGGPLALAALYAPQAVHELHSGGGLVTLVAPLVFLLPLWVWLRYSRDVHGPGGLYAFVRAAAGERVARAQAAVWAFSYLLYLLSTTAYVVNDVLPAVSPRLRPYRSALELALPLALAAVVLAGRRVLLVTLAVVAGGQLALVALLDVVAVGHGTTAAAFTAPSQPHELASATMGVALLFVCGSLPLFFGGELHRPAQTIRRVLPIAFAVTAAVVVVAVLPLALDPAFGNAEIPGMSLVAVDVGTAAATAVGLGVAVSIVGVMLLEYAAVVRLGHAVTGRSMRRIAQWLAGALVVAAPLSLLDPERFYRDLLKPSLVALWLSQLMVVAVYPRFAGRAGRTGRFGRMPHTVVGAGASLVMLFGLWTSLTGGAAT
jgi:hypothetical protein